MTRNIIIHPVLNGFVCDVGCQKVVFNTREAMLRALDNYYKDPEGIEHLFINNAINKPYASACPPAPCEPNACDAQTGSPINTQRR